MTFFFDQPNPGERERGGGGDCHGWTKAFNQIDYIDRSVVLYVQYSTQTGW